MAEHQVDAPRPQEMQEPEKQGRGCLFYGCLILAILAVVVLLVVGGGAYWTYNYFKSFTADKPMDIPVVEAGPGEYEALKARVEAFKKALDEGKKAEIALSGKDINLLIGNDPEWKDLKGRAHVTIEGDEIKADASIPIPKDAPVFKGRYINGTIGMKVSLANGTLFLSPKTIVVNEKAVPDQIMKELQKQNFAAETCKDEDAAKAIEKFESIQVKDGKITIKSSGAK